MIELGKIEAITDLRQIWPNEAQDFTPWLAKNLDRLGEALGMDLKLRATEARVGAFSLDVLAVDLGTNRSVIIENQLEPTDHQHLGQLLTYAAGYDAYTAVWVTRDFRDEHRAALRWLNGHTNEDTQFFGVVVEVWKHGESKPAPHFEVVAKPRHWRKPKSAPKVGRPHNPNPLPLRERYRVFFQDLADTLRFEHQFTTATTALPRNWKGFSSEIRNVNYRVSFSNDLCQVAYFIRGDLQDTATSQKIYDTLHQHRDAIEGQLGSDLIWVRNEGPLWASCRIAASQPASIDDDPDTLDELQEWVVERLLAFKETLTPYSQET